MFLCTHLPQVPRWIGQVPLSDKTLHYAAYLILIFLLWFAINPDRKVNWRKAPVWWILFIVVWYGAMDEWLQSYVGRDADIMDFFADLLGTVTGLIVLSFFPFWPASLAMTGAAIFILTNSLRANIAEQLPILDAAFHFCAYSFFSMLWARYIHNFLHVKPPQFRWFIGVLALPAGLLFAFEIFLLFAGNELRPLSMLTSFVGIITVVLIIFLTVTLSTFLRQKFFTC
jgi:hypothetical protein